MSKQVKITNDTNESIWIPPGSTVTLRVRMERKRIMANRSTWLYAKNQTGNPTNGTEPKRGNGRNGRKQGENNE